jgi:transcriptional regulator with XRE-family HTH domain
MHETFGQRLRNIRMRRGLGLREFARRVGVSPTYLTQVEKDACPKPTEERVIAMARALDQHPDEFLALAGRIASDLDQIIRTRPRSLPTFLRVAQGLSDARIEEITRQIGEQRQ